MIKKRNSNYDRVMPRVYNNSRASLMSSSNVTRHEIPSSARVGAKQSGSNVSSGVFSELPTVLNDYVPESSRGNVKRSNVVKPKRTLKSLDPAKSPPRVLTQAKELRHKPRVLRAQGSVPSVVNRVGDKWSDSYVRQCYSSRSHTRLKELKDEIKAYQDTEKLMKIRSHLYKSCGVVLDDVGQVAVDKAVQAEGTSTDMEVKGIRMDSNFRKGKPINSQAREIVYNVYLYFVNEASVFKNTENGYFNRVQERVVNATGVSRRFLQNLLNEKDRNGSSAFKTPKKGRPIKELDNFDDSIQNMKQIQNPTPLADDHDESEQSDTLDDEPTRSYIKETEKPNTNPSVKSIQHILAEVSKLTDAWKDDDEFDLFGKTVAVNLKKLPLVSALNLQQEMQALMNRYRIALSQTDHSRIPISTESPASQIELPPLVPISLQQTKGHNVANTADDYYDQQPSTCNKNDDDDDMTIKFEIDTDDETESAVIYMNNPEPPHKRVKLEK